MRRKSPCLPRVTSRPSSDVPPALERLADRDLVRVLQLGPDRQAETDARDPQAERLQEARQVDGGGLSLDVRVGGQDDLLDRSVPETLQERGDLQVVRP